MCAHARMLLDIMTSRAHPVPTQTAGPKCCHWRCRGLWPPYPKFPTPSPRMGHARACVPERDEHSQHASSNRNHQIPEEGGA
eukprot:6880241-Pyramimonas_sp.AAC.1